MNRFLMVMLIACLFQFSGFSQEKINDYKYVIIPMQYEFQKSEDQYQINSLTKFLFNKYGYTAFFQNEEYPKDLIANRCLAMTANIINLKGFLSTKLQIELRDCDKNLIAASKEGKSKVKEFKKAYNLAIRDAFSTFQFFNYAYKENKDVITRNEDKLTNEEKEIERLVKEVEALKEKAAEKTIVSTEPSEKTAEEVLEQVKEEPIQVKEIEATATTKNTSEILYAQPIEGGYQVVDTEPKKVMVLLLSGSEDYYIVKGKDAVVYKKDKAWIYAENDGKNVTIKEIKLKF